MRSELLAMPGGEVETEIHVPAADGAEQIVHVRACNALDDPDIGAIVIVSRNVTEHRRAVADLALGEAPRRGARRQPDPLARHRVTTSCATRSTLRTVCSICSWPTTCRPTPPGSCTHCAGSSRAWPR